MTAQANPAVASLPHVRSNTGLRGVAALAVVAYHLQLAGYRFPVATISQMIDRCYLMVDLFFVLSGYILSYANGVEKFTGAPSVKTFMVSRLVRIYPLHAFCLLYLVLGAGIGDLAFGMIGRDPVFADWSWDSLKLLLAQVTLTNGWFLTQSGWNTPTWSISVEMLAYLAFPILLVAFKRWGTPFVILVVAAIMLFYGAIGVTSGSLDVIGRVAILRCLAGFAIGMLIFRYRASAAGLSDLGATVLQLVSVAGILVVLAFRPNDVLIVPAFVLLVIATIWDRGLLGWLTGTRLLQFLGEISYSVYLNHACLLILVTPFWGLIASRAAAFVALPPAAYIPVFFSCVLIVSYVTYRWVELPSRKRLNTMLRFRRGLPASTPSAP
jgi:peptidoglycan/LPS O-acetylase OafA/YrhL